jgi:CHAT domain-containing protein/tetratricopeptide (TPR) repeat protein
VYQNEGKYDDTAALYRRALAIKERTLGTSHPDLVPTLNNLATLSNDQGQHGEAEALYQRTLAIEEKLPGANLAVAKTLNNLSLVYQSQGRYRDAAAICRRALAIVEKTLGPSHPSVAAILKSLALIDQSQSDDREAEVLYQRALTIEQKALGDDHPELAATMVGLARVYLNQKQFGEAEQFSQRALSIEEKALGSNHPDVAKMLNNRAIVFSVEGKYTEAEELYRRSLAIKEAAFGSTHPDVAETLYNLALASASAGDLVNALAYSRRAIENTVTHAAKEQSVVGGFSETGDLIEQRANYFRRHLVILTAATTKGIEPPSTLAREAFQIAQWAMRSSAAAALQQTGVRVAGGNATIAALVRENQDLAATWRSKDKLLATALSNPERLQNGAATDNLRKQMADIDKRRAANAAELELRFPDFAALANPKPLSVDDVQELLGADEALVFLLTDAQQGYVFALTRSQFDWRTIPLGANDLSQRVAALRGGLDVNKVVGTEAVGKTGLFDLALAHQLYDVLLGPVEPLIKDRKQLIIVPTGSLTALPFHVLVTEEPVAAVPGKFAGYRDAAWLIKRQAVAIMPSVTSLRVLRTFARSDVGSKPMVGFGDPAFNPDTKATGNTRLAKGAARSLITGSYTDFWQGAAIDRVKLAQALPQLPDTADELNAVAKNLGATASDIHLGRDANETTVKRTTLADYRIIYFATHGLVAGDVKGVAEPALALSIPKQPTELDDGLLTASEIAQLKLNADWVVLSACNTIAGDRPGAEALSGLARAFFYAGSRALLATHWAVDSTAATRLTTSTFDLLMRDPRIGRAEALRQAMLAYLNDDSSQDNAYPAIWGPFALIGEGNAR